MFTDDETPLEMGTRVIDIQTRASVAADSSGVPRWPRTEMSVRETTKRDMSAIDTGHATATSARSSFHASERGRSFGAAMR